MALHFRDAWRALLRGQAVCELPHNWELPETAAAAQEPASPEQPQPSPGPSAELVEAAIESARIERDYSRVCALERDMISLEKGVACAHYDAAKAIAARYASGGRTHGSFTVYLALDKARARVNKILDEQDNEPPGPRHNA